MVRVKKRYILGELQFEIDESNKNSIKTVETLTQKEVQDLLKQAVENIYGEIGFAQIS